MVSMTQTPTGDLAARLAAITHRFRASEEVEDLAAEICRAARELVGEGCEVAVTLLRAGGRIDTVAATVPVCFEVDRFQEQYGEGPCVSAVREAPVTHLPDTATDTTWPRFSRWAADHGVASMMGVRLHTFEGAVDEVGGAGLGALNFYADAPHRFDDDAEHRARLVEAPASLALSHRQHISHLHRALDSRDLIGQAKGVLMERTGAGPEGAFELLRQRSRTTNVRLAEVAREVVTGDTGD